jgi:drug/metabolite transporter (DMT)-like permease
MPKKDCAAAPFWGVILAFAIMYVAWGTTYLAIKKGVRDESLPAYLFGGLRIGTAGILLLLVQAGRGKPLVPRARQLPSLLVAAVCLFVFGNGLITLGEKTVDSGMASVLAATTPLWMGLFGMFWPRGERLNLWGWVGLALGLAGVFILLSPNVESAHSLFADYGPWLVIGSAVCWALGSLFLKHNRPGGDHLSSAAQQMVLGGSLMCLIGLAGGEAEQLPATITPGAAYAFFHLLIAGSLMGFVAFNWLLGHVSASKVGTYSYVNPVVAVLVGAIDGEMITWSVVAGIGVILLGVFLVREGEQEKVDVEASGPAEVAPFTEAACDKP